jgi:hypothetical protein
MSAAELALRTVWGWWNRATGRFMVDLLPRATSLLGYIRNPRQVVFAWPTEPIPLGRKVALFVHFDRDGAVHEHVLNTVAGLGEAGWSVVVVSNSGQLQPDGLAALQDRCAGVLVRRNVGYDFGAWRDALERLGLPRADTEQVAIVNDSIYGPLTPLRQALSRIDVNAADVWGLTDSWQRRYHLQSYFLVFSRKVLDSAAWRKFWRRVRPAPSKHYLIQRYEVGLTQAMLRAGFRCQALWPYADLLARALAAQRGAGKLDRHQKRIAAAASARQPLNPTSDLWRQLLEARYPFIKRELLRDNPSRVADVNEWREVARRVLRADVSPIDRDLQKTLKNRAPW